MVISELAPLDRDSPVPLYHQLRLSLEAWTQSRVHVEECLPTEAELSEMFGVSRITVRQTIASMLEDGILYRKRARGRLFAAPAKIHQQLTRLRGFFTDDLLAAAVKPNTHIISVERTSADRVAERLGITDSATVFRIVRLHEGDGEPMALQVSYVPEVICPHLDRLDLSRSIFRLLEEEHGVPIVRAVQRVWVRPALKEEASLLFLGSRAHVIEVERTSFDSADVPVEYFTAALRSDRYDFVMDLRLRGETERSGGETA